MNVAQALKALGACRLGALCWTWTLVLVLAPMARAQTESPAVWLNAGFYTAHFSRNHQLRDANPGLGLEYSLNADTRLTAGRFLNSDNAYSNYLGVYYQPWQLGTWKAGAAAGLFNGYPKAFGGGWFPAVLPVVSWEGNSLGINVALVPEIKNRLYGGFSFQLKYRIP
jgi:hypothetical protein